MTAGPANRIGGGLDGLPPDPGQLDQENGILILRHRAGLLLDVVLDLLARES